MSAEDESPIDRGRLESTWPADEPPAGFADRVMAARARDGAARPRRRPALLGAAAGLLALAAVAAMLLAGPGTVTGARSVAARESIALGRRGVAVAEAGARLSWRVHRGDAEIDQPAGDVFYRVEHGGPFVVRTPAGEVRVQGTCFRVEVEPMTRWMHMGAGAAIAAAVMVTVYEGKVLFANEHGQVALGAGEQARAVAGQAPGPAGTARSTALASASAPSDAISRDELLRRDAAQRAEIARLEQKLQAAQAARPSDGRAREGDSSAPFFAPDKAQLAKMAKECRLKWDAPRIGLTPGTLSPETASRLGLSDDERAAYDHVLAQLDNQVVAQLRAIYIEVTGDKAGADSLTPRALEEEIFAKSAPADVKAAYYRISHERAGLQAPPADPSGEPPVERLQRLLSGLGDEFERELGQELGPDLAHQLRADRDGWGSKSESSYGCP